MGKRLLIAGGGTGGHLFPGMAVAEEWLAAEPDNEVLFVGSGSGIETQILPSAGYPFKTIRVRPLVGQGRLEQVKGLLLLPLSLFQALKVIRGFKPDAALGVGGYVAGPVLLAAWLLRLPTAIQEQNALPGSTNLILGGIVDRVFANLEYSRPAFAKADRRGRLTVCGNPIRRAIRKKIEEGRGHPAANHRVCLLVIGGSQGARKLNYLVLEAMLHLKPLHDAIKVFHQTGSGDVLQIVSTYARLDIRARVQEFITDMAGALCEADVILSRAGAGAVAEIALAGKPSILVPFPYAAGDHQTINAKAVVAAGGALMFQESGLSGLMLAEALRPLLTDAEKRREMGEKVHALAVPDAAETIARGLYELLAAKGKA